MIVIQVSQVSPTRPERAEALSPRRVGKNLRNFNNPVFGQVHGIEKPRNMKAASMVNEAYFVEQ